MQDYLKQIIKEAGKIALDYYRKGVTSKDKANRADVVTIADVEVENFLIKKIKEKYPDHGIIGEESGEDTNSDAQIKWVIDPIDGTRNFANHIAFWCTMVGIEKDGQPYMSAVYDAINDELYFAEIGKGASVNEEKIQVNDYNEIEHCFLAYSGGAVEPGSPYDPDNFEGYQRFSKNLMKDKGHWINMWGSMLTICHLAAGRLDAYLNNTGQYHDILAPYVIATEAGAKFTDSDGNNWKRGKKDIVVANSELHEKLLKLFE
jgi:myo-inositol-1(or 4)-monophosphatase